MTTSVGLEKIAFPCSKSPPSLLPASNIEFMNLTEKHDWTQLVTKTANWNFQHKMYVHVYIYAPVKTAVLISTQLLHFSVHKLFPCMCNSPWLLLYVVIHCTSACLPLTTKGEVYQEALAWLFMVTSSHWLTRCTALRKNVCSSLGSALINHWSRTLP